MDAYALPPTTQPAHTGEAELWRQFRQARGEGVRGRLVSRYLEFARMLAARMYARRTYLELEFADYLQYARVGLLEAIDRYEEGHGAKFETFAAHRINGAILNGIASYSEVQEQVAARRRILSERLAGLHTDAPKRDDPAALFAYLAELAVGLAVGFALEGTGMVSDDSGSGYVDQAYAGLELRQLRMRLKEMLAGLNERQRMVLSWHYLLQRPFDEIATELGVTKGRVSQLHKQALGELRERWRDKHRLDWSF
jgi:RNA polymerase sigma factor for flagellar operon FliA